MTGGVADAVATLFTSGCVVSVVGGVSGEKELISVLQVFFLVATGAMLLGDFLTIASAPFPPWPAECTEPNNLALPPSVNVNISSGGSDCCPSGF